MVTDVVRNVCYLVSVLIHQIIKICFVCTFHVSCSAKEFVNKEVLFYKQNVSVLTNVDKCNETSQRLACSL